MAEGAAALPDSRMRVEQTQKEQWKKLCAAGNLYAVVDACGEPKVPQKVKTLGPARAISLYRSADENNKGANKEESPGTLPKVDQASQYEHVAPYLLHLDEPTFDWIGDSLWSSPWGIFVYGKSTMEALRMHFRRFLKVKGPDNKMYFFRFYDPRVLPPFLQSCDDRELAQFFGPVTAYGVTAGDGVTLMRARNSAQG